MKAEELMIGDWVQHLNKYFKVFMVMGSKIYMEDSNRETTVQHIRSLQPINITPEILEKNGFKKDVHNCSIYYDWSNLDGDDVTLKRFPCGYFEVHITDNENLRNVRFPIDYVHELQHILRLCKIDKEIEME